MFHETQALRPRAAAPLAVDQGERVEAVRVRAVLEVPPVWEHAAAADEAADAGGNRS